MKRLAAILVATLVAVAACRPAAPPVTAAHAEWAASQWPAITRADLERGRQLYMTKCSACHRPRDPMEHAPGEWPGEIAEMQERAHLAPDEVMLIEHYVVTVASMK